MVKSSNQSWQVGRVVKVGFLRLRVTACVPTPDDGAPDAYFLTNLTGDKLYEFVPHHGLRLTTLDQAAERVATYRQHVERIAAQATSRAAKADSITRRFKELFAEVA